MTTSDKEPLPDGKVRVTLMLDEDVLEALRAEGGDISDRINALLRVYFKLD